MTKLTVTGVSAKPASLASTDVAALSSDVAVPPSETEMASGLATGVASLTGLTVILTVPMLELATTATSLPTSAES